jgi:hemin uptake protein HemP
LADESDGDPQTPQPPCGASHVLDSSALFGASAEVVIRHNGRHYRLRRTRLGKLILTA